MSETFVRLVSPADADVLSVLLSKDRHRYSRWLPTRPDQFYSAKGQDATIDALLTAKDRGLAWPAVILDPVRVVGQITLSGILRGPFEKAFVGYWLASDVAGKGHATAALRHVVDVAQNELALHRLEAHTQLENVASQQVLRRNGFSAWGVAHGHFLAQGEWRDEMFWERPLGGPAS